MPAYNLQVIDGFNIASAPNATILQPRNAPPIRMHRYDREITTISDLGGVLQIDLAGASPATASAVSFYANGAWQRGAITSGAGTSSVTTDILTPTGGILTFSSYSAVFDIPDTLRADIFISQQGRLPRKISLRYSRDEFGFINFPLWNVMDFMDGAPSVVGSYDPNAVNAIKDVVLYETTEISPLDGVSLFSAAGYDVLNRSLFIHKEKLPNFIRGSWTDSTDGYFLGKRVADMNTYGTRDATLTYPDQPIWCGYPSPMSLIASKDGITINSGFIVYDSSGSPIALNSVNWGVFPPTMFCEFTPFGYAWDASISTGGYVLYSATPMMSTVQRFELRPSRYNTYAEQEVFLVARSPLGGWVWWLFESAKPTVAVTNTTTFANSYFPAINESGGYLQRNAGSSYAAGRVPAPRKSVESSFQIYATQVSDVHAPIFAMIAASEEVYWCRVRNASAKYYKDFMPVANNEDLPIELVRVDIQPANTQIANESLASMAITFNVTVSNE